MFRHNIPAHHIILDRPLSLRERQSRQTTYLFREELSQRTIWSRFLLIALLLVVASVLLFLMSGRAEAAANTTEGREWDINAPQLMLKQKGQLTPAVMLGSEIKFDVSGMVVKATLSQHFKNHSSDWLEGVYLLPLPENAGVNRLTMQVGERLIEGEIKEREQAKKIFEEAKKSGKRATLLEQQRPNMFSNSVANIAPGEEVIVTVTYLQTLNYRDGEFDLRFPMTITPRYSPGLPLAPSVEEPAQSDIDLSGDISWALPTQQVTDADKVSPYMMANDKAKNTLVNPISISASIDAGMPLTAVTSDSHGIVVENRGGKYQLHLTAPQVSMDRDFVLRWRPALGGTPKAALFTEQVDGEAYGLLMLMPPAQVKEESVTASNANKILPKEMIFVIDTSGSMGGTPISQAKESLMMALNWLRPEDSFNLIQFNHSTSMLFPQAMPATDSALYHARQYVKRLESDGGTEMLPALQAALNNSAQATDGHNRIRQVVFVTDGSVSNETALFQTIQNTLGDSRLFTVGIGSAPNSYFMRKAAEFGRGSFTYISKLSEVQPKMSQLFKRLSSPVVDEIALQWPDGTSVEVYPARIPTLYLDEPLLITFKRDRLDGQLQISGKTAGKPWRRILTLSGKVDSQGISTLWARAKIEGLLDQKIAGADETKVRPQVLAVALKHQLVSPYTSFVAVEKTPARQLAELMKKVPVANLHPEGTTTQSYAIPKTATGADITILVGALLMLLAWVVRMIDLKVKGRASVVTYEQGGLL